MRRALVLTIAVLALTLLGAGTALAAGATIVVNSSADGATAADGVCTLREAISNANANADTTSGDCVPGAADDSITFASTVTGTITLASTLPTITDTAGLTLQGPGAATLTISGNSAVQVLSVATGAPLVVDGLTLAHAVGAQGGAIHNLGTLTVSHATLSANFATVAGGGIYNLGGKVVISDSTLSENIGFVRGGGGVYTDGPLTVSDSTFSGNQAVGSLGSSAGGGIDNVGALTKVSNSTFSGNQAPTSSGGGLANEAPAVAQVSGSTFTGNQAIEGAGIYNSGQLDVSNSTFSGNTAAFGGALRNDSGTLFISYSTLAGNSASSGGGIGGASNALFASVILASNSGGDCLGHPVDSGYNSSSDTSCAFSAPTSLSSTDPKLGPLANNGGPTQTMALLAGSPAIDLVPTGVAGCGAFIATDQRGVTRPQGPSCDIGAYERTAESDGTPPTCILNAQVTGPPKQLKIELQDHGSGIATVTPTATNASVDVPSFTAGTTDPLIITATKADQSKGATVALRVSDVAGNVTTCDPRWPRAARHRVLPVRDKPTG